MEISKRNRDVAVARWKNIHERERKNIRDDRHAVLYKAALCGFLAGDGCVQHRQEKTYRRWQIRFFPDNHLMLQVYLSYMEYVYRKQPSGKLKKNFYCVSLTSKIVGTDLLNIASFDTKSWRVPDFVRDCMQAQTYWLRGFFSAEAYVNDDVIRVQTVNEDGMKEVSALLDGLGIAHGCYVYSPNQDTYSDVHIIVIQIFEAKQRYSQKFGFWHDKKTRALDKALHSKTNS